MPAIVHAFAVLRYLRDASPGLATAAAIARELGINRSSAYNILRTLEVEFAVTRDPLTHGYRLGPTLAELGWRAARTDAEYAKAIVQRIAESTDFDCTCLVLRPEINRGYVVIDKIDSNRPLKVTAEIGERFPLTAGAVAKAYLAHQSEDTVDSIITRELRPYTKRSIVSSTAFKEELKRVRRDGYGLNRGEYYPGHNAVAVPLLDSSGHVILLVCALGFSEELSDSRLKAYGVRLRAIVGEVSQHGSAKSPQDYRVQDVAQIDRPV